MPVTLNEAKSNAVEDLDVAVIDEFRKESAILDELIFDWRSFATADAQHAALDVIDEFLSSLDGAPTVIFVNAKALAKIRAAARRAQERGGMPVVMRLVFTRALRPSHSACVTFSGAPHSLNSRCAAPNARGWNVNSPTIARRRRCGSSLSTPLML